MDATTARYAYETAFSIVSLPPVTETPLIGVSNRRSHLLPVLETVLSTCDIPSLFRGQLLCSRNECNLVATVVCTGPP